MPAPGVGKHIGRRGFIEFEPLSKSAQGRTFWYAEGWIGGQRFEFSTQLDQDAACVLCQRLNTVIEAALASPK